MQAVAPLAAQARRPPAPHGASGFARAGYGPPCCWRAADPSAQVLSEALLLAVGQAPEGAPRVAARYSAASPGAWCPPYIFLALRNFMSAVNRPEPALWITLAAIPANGLLAYALIYGAMGLPRLELLGAGIATTLISIGMCVAALLIAAQRAPFKKYRVLGRCWRPD